MLQNVCWRRRQVEIRKMKEKDIEGVINLLQTHWITELPTSEFISKYLRDDNIHTFIAIDDDEIIIGSASLYVQRKLIRGGSYAGSIEEVIVDKKNRKKGLGKALIQHIIRYAVELGCYKVILSCHEYNIPFYENCGFVVESTTMRKDIS